MAGKERIDNLKVGSLEVFNTLTYAGTDLTGALDEVANLAGVTASAAEINKIDGITGSVVEAQQATFTETTGAGVYTASLALPAGATIQDIIVNGVALWDSQTSATMIVGDGTDPDGYYTAIDLKATDLLAGESISFALAGGKAGAYIANSQVSPRYNAAAVNIIGEITKVGSSGTAGRTRMVVIYVLPQSSTAATKV
jgi:hypothetical protein